MLLGREKGGLGVLSRRRCDVDVMAGLWRGVWAAFGRGIDVTLGSLGSGLRR